MSDTLYDELEARNLQWGRYSDNEIYVWTPGYRTREAWEVEQIAMKSGMFCLRKTFDSHCGQTLMRFKQQKGA